MACICALLLVVWLNTHCGWVLEHNNVWVLVQLFAVAQWDMSNDVLLSVFLVLLMWQQVCCSRIINIGLNGLLAWCVVVCVQCVTDSALVQTPRIRVRLSCCKGE